ncbi:MAG TPA: hypothetical protein VFA26_01705 [Gemmataceae bacterium]|nr:hypothetical protein [Gemmataceae bacterium]
MRRVVCLVGAAALLAGGCWTLPFARKDVKPPPEKPPQQAIAHVMPPPPRVLVTADEVTEANAREKARALREEMEEALQPPEPVHGPAVASGERPPR